jgi:hypothetical protein
LSANTRGELVRATDAAERNAVSRLRADGIGRAFAPGDGLRLELHQPIGRDPSRQHGVDADAVVGEVGGQRAAHAGHRGAQGCRQD